MKTSSNVNERKNTLITRGIAISYHNVQPTSCNEINICISLCLSKSWFLASLCLLIIFQKLCKVFPMPLRDRWRLLKVLRSVFVIWQKVVTMYTYIRMLSMVWLQYFILVQYRQVIGQNQYLFTLNCHTASVLLSQLFFCTQ